MNPKRPSLSDLVKVRQDVQQHKRPTVKHPSGWEPHVEEHGDTAVAVSQPIENATPDERELIVGWQLDPDVWEIVGEVNCRRWQVSSGDWLHYYKANLKRRTAFHSDISDLLEMVKKRKPIKPADKVGDRSFLVCPADFQIGCGDVDGSVGRVDRTLASFDAAVQRFKDLRKLGHQFSSIYVSFMGDLVENCSEFYPSQQFTCDLNLRDQQKVVRQLAYYGIDKFAGFGVPIVVASVPGNHGQTRLGGKPYTGPSDNMDISCIESVAEALAFNPERYGHVSFMFPDRDDLSISLDISGVPVGFIHGHQAKNGTGPIGKMTNWWKNQAYGETNVGSTKILCCGHYHHQYLVAEGAKTIIGCAATDGFSDWWRLAMGQTSASGITTLVVGENVSATGWSEYQVV